MERKTLRTLREERGLTQFEVAVKLGVSLGSVANWESGRNDPPATRLRQIANLYGVSMDAIILPGDADDSGPGSASPGAVGDR